MQDISSAIKILSENNYIVESSTCDRICKLEKFVKSKKIKTHKYNDLKDAFYFKLNDSVITISLLNEAIDITLDNNVSKLCRDVTEAKAYLTTLFNDFLTEDFSMGVGGPMGLDQGIPHGGDGKGCVAKRMGLYQRSPFGTNPYFNGVPDAHHPNYWLNQIPKKRKKRRRRRLHENMINNAFATFKQACLSLYLKAYGKEDCKKDNISTETLTQNFLDGLMNGSIKPDRASTLGRVAARIFDRFRINSYDDEDNLHELLKAYKHELKIHRNLGW